jgi:hypothetical protein
MVMKKTASAVPMKWGGSCGKERRLVALWSERIRSR